MAFSHGDYRPVAPEDHTDVLRILDERRIDLIKQNGRLINQLHAIMRELLPGGIECDLDTEHAATELKRFAPDTPSDAMHKKVGLEIVGDLRRLRFQIGDLTDRIKIELKACGTRLPKIPGVGVVTAPSTLRFTSSPSPRPAPRAALATPITAARSPNARLTEKRRCV